MKNVFKISILLGLSFGMLVSCSKKDDGNDSRNQSGAPILLDCNYFKENRVLKKIPNASVDYVINCLMHVRAEIVVEPGVVIEFEHGSKGNTGIIIDPTSAYSFSAVGTPDKPIIFRGVKNEMGFWTGILFHSLSDKNELKHVIVEDAGNDSETGPFISGCVVLAKSSAARVTYTTISNCENYGLRVLTESPNITIGNNNYTKNRVPINIITRQLDKLDSNSNYSGNINDYVYLARGMGTPENTSWRKLNVPYKFSEGLRETISVDVTIDAGVEFIMSENSGVRVVTGGTLRMNGTAQDKIIFRGETDVPAHWRGIEYYKSTGTLNKMSHVEIRNAGNVSNPAEPNGALRLSNSFLAMDNVAFKNCFDFAVSSLLLSNGNNTNDFTFTNIVLNNTPRKFGDWNNVEIHF